MSVYDVLPTQVSLDLVPGWAENQMHVWKKTPARDDGFLLYSTMWAVEILLGRPVVECGRRLFLLLIFNIGPKGQRVIIWYKGSSKSYFESMFCQSETKSTKCYRGGFFFREKTGSLVYIALTWTTKDTKAPVVFPRVPLTRYLSR